MATVTSIDPGQTAPLGDSDLGLHYFTLVNVYVDLVVFTHIAGTS